MGVVSTVTGRVKRNAKLGVFVEGELPRETRTCANSYFDLLNTT